MAEQKEAKWPTCKQAGCIGIRLPSASMCLAHAGEEEAAATLKRIGETGEIDARGVPITPALLERILTAAPRGENERPLIKGCWFDRATFTGDVGFGRATFEGDAEFGQATFEGDADFGQATFTGAGFNRATFNSEAWFRGATFTGAAWFNETTFTGQAWFVEATFTGNAQFNETTFTSVARFDETRFEQARQLGPLLAYRGLVLDDVQFAEPVQIEVSSTGVCCRRARFAGGVQFRLRWARVVLDDTDLAAPSILAGIPRLASEQLARREEQIAGEWRRLLAGEIPGRPQLVSLRRANVAGLGLSNVSAADCRFAGAHSLDKLRLESDVSFATAPLPVGLGGRRWSGREVIAEERAWRAGPRSIWFRRLGLPRGGRTGWATSGPASWIRDRSPGCTGRCARDARTSRTSRAPPTSTTARWRCAAPAWVATATPVVNPARPRGDGWSAAS